MSLGELFLALVVATLLALGIYDAGRALVKAGRARRRAARRIRRRLVAAQALAEGAAIERAIKAEGDARGMVN